MVWGWICTASRTPSTGQLVKPRRSKCGRPRVAARPGTLCRWLTGTSPVGQPAAMAVRHHLDGLEPGRRSTQTDGLDIRHGCATLGAPDVPSSTGNACTIHVSEMTADQSVSSCPRSPRTAGPSRMIAPVRSSCLRCPLRVSWTTCSSGRPMTCRAGSSRRSPPMCARRANRPTAQASRLTATQLYPRAKRRDADRCAS